MLFWICRPADLCLIVITELMMNVEQEMRRLYDSIRSLKDAIENFISVKSRSVDKASP